MRQEVRIRHYFYYLLNRFIVSNIIRLKHRFKGEVIKKKRNEPHLVLINHQSELDPFLIFHIYHAPIYVVANEQITTNPFYGPLLQHFINAVPIRKGTIDLKALRRLKQITKEKGSIMLFPEGNSTYDGQLCAHINNPGKLAKMLQVDVVVYNLNGPYFANPRWSKYRKHNKTYGVIRKVISKEEVNSLPLEKLEEIIKESLTVNPYNLKLLYKGQKLAEGLERLIFVCPHCLQLDTTFTKNNKLFCSNCQFEATYGEDGYLMFDHKKHQLHELSRPLIDEFEKIIIKNPNLQFNESVSVKVCWSKRRRRLYRHLSFLINQDGLSLVGKKINFQITYPQIIGFGLQQKKKLVVYANGLPTLIIIFPENVSIFKYYIAFHIFTELQKKGVENYELLTHLKLNL